ncbi:MFS transporter [Shigella flexneri]
MLGMFMVLPVLTTYGMALQGASEALMGIPWYLWSDSGRFWIRFGLLSDRIGREPTSSWSGLAVFAAGWLSLRSLTPSGELFWVRALQGSGAIAAAVMALLFRSHARTNRTKAMAFIGVSFGITFAIAMVLHPIITHNLGCTRCSG